jgi:hypothetical protein
MVVVGWMLMVIGIIAIGAGVVGGILAMFRQIRTSPAATGGLTSLPTEFVEVLIKFLDSLKSAPAWLALIIIGIALVAWGGAVIT